jgi:hypothetical protein
VTPRLFALLGSEAAVLWTWTAASLLGFGVQMGLGMRRPSEGLALSAAAVPAALVAALPRRARRAGMVAVVVLTALVGVANAVHYRAFQTYLPLRALVAVDQGWSVRGYAAGLLGPADLVPAALVLVTVAGAVLARRRERGGSEEPRTPRTPGAGPPPSGHPRPKVLHRALPLALCVLGSLPALGRANWLAPRDPDNQTGGFLCGHVVDASRIARAWTERQGPIPEETALVTRRLEKATPPAAGAGTVPPEGAVADPWLARPRGAHVLRIQVEALNGWVLDVDVGGEPVAPFLRSLARRGLVFTRVLDQTYLGRSSGADYLALVSQHPTRYDAVAMA